MSSLKNTIDDFLRDNPGRDTFKIEHNGEYFWVKKGRETGSNLLQKTAYAISKNPLLIPVSRKSKKETLDYEVAKLERLYSQNISVPEVAYAADNYFVMKDRGDPVYYGLKKRLILDSENIISKCLDLLCSLHGIGEFHGGSQLKNFVLTANGDVSMLDFEESFSEDVDIKTLFYRDLFLFLFSLAKTGIEIDYKTVMERYIDATGNEYVRERLVKLAGSGSFVMKILENSLLWRIADNDTKSVYKLLKSLKKSSI